MRDGPSDTISRIIETQQKTDEIRVIDLSNEKLSYEEIVDAIFEYDRVISW